MSTLQLAYDSYRHDDYWRHSQAWRTEWQAWLRQHGVEPNDTYRVEFHLIDAPLIRVFQQARNEDGDHYVDPASREVAQRPPFDVLIRTPAPRPEDYR